MRKALCMGADINAPVPTTEEVLFEYNFGQIEATRKQYNKTGFTPLALAISSGLESMVRSLLEVDGIDVNWHNIPERLSPLTLAILVGNEDIVKILLTVDGIDPEIMDRYNLGNSLMVAASQGLVNMVKLLLAHEGVDPNKGNPIAQSPIWLATYKGHTQVVALLLEAGASPHPPGLEAAAPYSWYAEPLYHAVDDKPKIVRDIINSPLFDKKRLDRPIEALQCEAMRHNRVEIFKFLFMVGCTDPNWNNGDGRTSLWWAAAYGQEEIVRLLLGVDGIDVNTKGRGETFTHEYVLQEGQSGPPGYGEGVTPLIVAAREGHSAIVELFLAADGIDVDARDIAFGETALLAAKSRSHEDIVELLQNGMR
ncbi:hypothetical protein Plec18167_002364 [Paecilomyces lecythidis]|uniref:Ankyrin n=1 Tax=Paecilomyces lecythidis TaxID=3004212 RepID=A0ABR3YAE3_9EURO